MSVYEIVFSPTGGTKKIAERISHSFAADVKTIDLTDPAEKFGQLQLTSNDICIVAVPSFGGRVPAPAADRLATLKGNEAKAILIAVYGNRAYEDTLLELKEILVCSGFHCTAAISAVAEHSIMHQFAHGRPDATDLAELSQFAQRIRAHILEASAQKQLHLPGNTPYRTYNGVPIKPVAKKSCTNCGVCAQKCPVQAIPLSEPSKTDSKVCISCMRCVTICPSHARSVNPILVTLAASKMKKSCSDRKKNELFIEA